MLSIQKVNGNFYGIVIAKLKWCVACPCQSNLDKRTQRDWKRPIGMNRLGALCYARAGVICSRIIFLLPPKMTQTSERETVVSAIRSVITLNGDAGASNQSLNTLLEAVSEEEKSTVFDKFCCEIMATIHRCFHFSKVMPQLAKKGSYVEIFTRQDCTLFHWCGSHLHLQLDLRTWTPTTYKQLVVSFFNVAWRSFLRC